jgi:tetratricopeptide (TPR) repeat protein
MDPRSPQEASREFERACECLAADNPVAAMGHLEKALKGYDNPGWYSFLGYCVARERGQYRKGMELCRLSIDTDPDNPLHYLNFAKIHLLSNNKTEAIAVMREGLARGPNEEIETMLKEVGARKPPVLSFLDRDNPINKYLGLLLSKVGLR